MCQGIAQGPYRYHNDKNHRNIKILFRTDFYPICNQSKLVHLIRINTFLKQKTKFQKLQGMLLEAVKHR